MTLAFEGVEEGDEHCVYCARPVIRGDNTWYHVFVEDRETCPGFLARREWNREHGYSKAVKV